MKQADLDALIARRERNIRRFFLWFWLVVVPILGVVLYFCVFAPGYHPAHVEPAQTPTFSCQQALSQTDIGGGSAIAPLCGATPYPVPGGDG